EAFKRQGTLTRQRYDENRLGASIGGPIRKKKLFYYGLYEYNPLGKASTPSGATFSPTAAGPSTLCSLSTPSATNLGILKQYLQPAPAQTSGNCGIREDVASCSVVNTVEIPTGILPIVQPNFENKYNWLVSADYSLAERDQLRGRYIDNKD